MRISDSAPACCACGSVAPSTPPPYTWSLTVGRSSRSWTCVPCSRSQLDSIESRQEVAA